MSQCSLDFSLMNEYNCKIADVFKVVKRYRKLKFNSVKNEQW